LRAPDIPQATPWCQAPARRLARRQDLASSRHATSQAVRNFGAPELKHERRLEPTVNRTRIASL
jgi:hypothetical protein